ncbi:MAG: hypothetical protein ABIM99_02740 [Candidatus Dojkabacteria bacterium]
MNQLALKLESRISSFAPVPYINSALLNPVIDYITYPLTEAEINYQADEIIELFQMSYKNLITDPSDNSLHEEFARCLSLVTYHIEHISSNDDFAEVITLPLLNLLRTNLENLSKEILRILYEEGDYASDEMVGHYKFLRGFLSKFNFNLDDELVPIVDAIYKRHSELILRENDVYKENPDLLLEMKPLVYEQEREFLEYILFD